MLLRSRVATGQSNSCTTQPRIGSLPRFAARRPRQSRVARRRFHASSAARWRCCLTDPCVMGGREAGAMIPGERVQSSAALLVLWTSYAAQGQGLVLPGAGPIDRGFGGTAIAAPLDSVGALYWNPATISFLDSARRHQLRSNDLEPEPFVVGAGQSAPDPRQRITPSWQRWVAGTRTCSSSRFRSPSRTSSPTIWPSGPRPTLAPRH